VNCTSRVRPFVCNTFRVRPFIHMSVDERTLRGVNPPFEDVHPPFIGVDQPFIRVVRGLQVAWDLGELHIPGASVYSFSVLSIQILEGR